MRDIPGYEGLYAVTEDGQVWSHSSNKWLKLQSSDAAGHLIVNLSRNNQTKTWGVHQLVLLTYIGPCPEGMESCHSNGISSDNNLNNLFYDTHQNNMLQSARDNHGKIARGIRVNTAKLDEDKVRTIRRIYTPGNIAALAREYGLSTTAMSNVINGKTWKHVS